MISRKKPGKIVAQLLRPDRVVFRQCLAKTITVVAALGRRQAGNEIALDPVDLLVAQFLQSRFRLGDTCRAVAGFGIPALQDENVVCGKIDRIETQGVARRWKPIGKVGAGPVDHRHEIIADRRNASLGERTDRVLVPADIAKPIRRADLDRIVDGNALHDRPGQPFGLDDPLALQDVRQRPGAAVVDIMQGGHDARGSGLLDMIERHRVVRAIPAPTLFHRGFPFAIKQNRIVGPQWKSN